MIKLSAKIWLFVLATMVITILFMYSLTNYLYQKLYVQDSENSMVEVGKKLANMYDEGKVTDDFVDDVDRYNMYSNINVFAVRNPRELSACVPFDIDYDTLIGPEERQSLIAGKVLTKQGYESRFDRQVISVVIPLVDEQRLEGILYLYFPLEKITELASKDVFMIIGAALVFFIIIGFVIFKALGLILKPLKQLQNAAAHMAAGRYATRVEVKSKDEIGQLSSTFNEMAQSIEEEDLNQKQFLENVSHELRTPISYIKGYSEAIISGIISEKEQPEKLALIVRETSRMEKLINEIMQLSRPFGKYGQFELYPLPLAESIREVTLMLSQRAKSTKISIQLQLDDDAVILADELKMKQIFINLLENAIRYSDENTVIDVSSTIKNSEAIVKIVDHGIGIPAEDLPKITERFYRVNKARSRVDGGSGLGLSIVEQLVYAHNGHWTISSELSKGTSITLYFPIVEEIE